MNKEELEIYKEDMKILLNEDEEKTIIEDFEKFKLKIDNIIKYELEDENKEIYVSPVYDLETTYLREDEVSNQVENAKEAVSSSKDYKDGFFTIPKVVN